MNPGMLYASLAFLCWGLFPLYFHAIGEIAPQEILAHRMVWSLLFLGIVLTVRRQWSWLGSLRSQPKVVASFVASAFLLSANWFIYIWAVNNGHVVDASLGYFITPLINVMLGFLLLHERLRRLQWLAIALAACGVAWLTWQAGQVPWIALLLAATFGGYGLLRKTAALGALEGLSFETLILFPLALAYMLWLGWQARAVSSIRTPPPRAPCCWRPVPSRPFPCCCSPPARGACRWPCWACCNISPPRASC